MNSSDTISNTTAGKHGTSFHRRAVLWLLFAWLAGVALVLSGLRQGYDTSKPYGTNYPGDLGRALTYVSVVTVLLLAIHAPAWRIANGWRVTLSVLVAAGALVYGVLMANHAGSIIVGASMWGIVVVLVIVVKTIRFLDA